MGKEYIKLDPAVEIARDTDVFLMDNGEKYLLQMESCCFLDKFHLKNCAGFEKWVSSMQNVYEKLFVDRFWPAMKKCMEREDFTAAEGYARKILLLDPYQEMACCALMQIYAARGDYNKAVLVYTGFAEALRKDVGVEPEPRTKDQYEKFCSCAKGGGRKGTAVSTEDTCRLWQNFQRSILNTAAERRRISVFSAEVWAWGNPWF